MPGVPVSDSLAPTLHNAVDIASATTTTGTGVYTGVLGLVRIEQTSALIGGTSPTIDTEIQVSDDNSTYTTVAKFDTLTGTDDSETHYIEAYLNKPYVRAVTISGGTSPTCDDLTVKIRDPHYKRTVSDSA